MAPQHKPTIAMAMANTTQAVKTPHPNDDTNTPNIPLDIIVSSIPLRFQDAFTDVLPDTYLRHRYHRRDRRSGLPSHQIGKEDQHSSQGTQGEAGGYSDAGFRESKGEGMDQ